MVCQRCQTAVKSELDKLGLRDYIVELGETDISGNLSVDQLKSLDSSLKEVGLELMTDKKIIVVERIKILIIKMVHFTEEQIKVNLSDYLADNLNHNYTYLSNLFSEVTGNTIEKFYLSNKIERVKEFLIYDELSLTEIAWKLHYSSVAHLSNQFKKMTGLTPSHFKNLKSRNRSEPGEDF